MANYPYGQWMEEVGAGHWGQSDFNKWDEYIKAGKASPEQVKWWIQEDPRYEVYRSASYQTDPFYQSMMANMEQAGEYANKAWGEMGNVASRIPMPYQDKKYNRFLQKYIDIARQPQRWLGWAGQQEAYSPDTKNLMYNQIAETMYPSFQRMGLGQSGQLLRALQENAATPIELQSREAGRTAAIDWLNQGMQAAYAGVTNREQARLNRNTSVEQAMQNWGSLASNMLGTGASYAGIANSAMQFLKQFDMDLYKYGRETENARQQERADKNSAWVAQLAPYVGAALGTIVAPGVGTAAGYQLGSTLGNAYAGSQSSGGYGAGNTSWLSGLGQQGIQTGMPVYPVARQVYPGYANYNPWQYSGFGTAGMPSALANSMAPVG